MRCVSPLEQACIDQDGDRVQDVLLNMDQHAGRKPHLDFEQEENIYNTCIFNHNLHILRLVAQVYPPKPMSLSNSMFKIVDLGHMDMLQWGLEHIKRIKDNAPHSVLIEKTLNCEALASFMLKTTQASPSDTARAMTMFAPFLNDTQIVNLTTIALAEQQYAAGEQLLGHVSTQDIQTLLSATDRSRIEPYRILSTVLEERTREVFKQKLLNSIPRSSLNTKTPKI